MFRLCLFISCLICLSGCQWAGTIFSATHKVASVVMDDRSLSDDYTDTKLNLLIRNALSQRKLSYAVDIELTVFEGAVLLNGALPDEHYIEEVVKTVWQTNGVEKVYNYIRLDEPLSIDKVNEDALVSAKIRYELSITRGISSANYKITMENKTVYLMGIIQDETELNKVIAVIKNTVNVKDIIILNRFQNN
ncbi:MAG: BON domain-containing protein [Alphaproteobacteria bacterium]|nr:BON domain-containing protein [Alphaproteobacteria bacterium]MBQ9089748.1 BON domain-containing protein [Alphaproteobacteria bacterium]